MIPEDVAKQLFFQLFCRVDPKHDYLPGVPEQTGMLFPFAFSHLEGVVEVNYLVSELSQFIPFFQLDSIPELNVSMEDA